MEWSCVLLPDGEIAELRPTVIRTIGDIRKDRANVRYERDWYLISRKAGQADGILLHEGDRDYSLEKLCLTGNGRYAAVCSPSRAAFQSALIVCRETGEVRSLDGMILIFLGSYDTGFVCFDADTGSIIRLDAETLARTELPVTGENCPEISLVSTSYLTGFGRIFCQQRGVCQGYFVAE